MDKQWTGKGRARKKETQNAERKTEEKNKIFPLFSFAFLFWPLSIEVHFRPFLSISVHSSFGGLLIFRFLSAV